MKKILNSKAQEEAPFELLVAVIIMGFVIIIGAQQIIVIQQAQCESDIQFQISNFKEAMELSINQKTTMDITLALPNCFEKKQTTFAVKKIIDDLQKCFRRCGKSVERCIIMEFSSQNPQIELSFCLDVNPNTFFSDPQSTGVCGTIEGYELVNVLYDTINTTAGAEFDSYRILNGQYKLINKTSLLEADPRLCVFKKAGK